jgi:nucleoside-diphosphate-sugar epimerase
LKILVTGASGFVGRSLVPLLVEAGFEVRATGRAGPGVAGGQPAGAVYVPWDLVDSTGLARLVAGMDAIVHLAARVHVLEERSQAPLEKYRSVNVHATQALYEAAAAAGARHFVFASTIKVNGEGREDRPYSEDDAEKPEDFYAVSKCEAEGMLRKGASETMLRATILRPPLMYGPGVGGNFRRLARAIERGVPLPLASLRNRRSLLYVGNFCAAIVAALRRPPDACRTYLVSDGEDVTPAELVTLIARSIQRPARLFPCPPAVLRTIGNTLGFGKEFASLMRSLTVDSSRIRRELEWSPSWSLEAGLGSTAEAPPAGPDA